MAQKSTISPEEIVLYDIPSRPPCKAWSLNTWRVRLILNYKNIPYRTQWLEYPDIKPTLQPHFQNSTIETYTVPTIALPGGKEHVMNSKDIARVLGAMYPSPPLLIDPPHAKRVTELQIKIWDAIEPIILTHVHKRLLNEINFTFWRETREPWLNPGNSNGKSSDTEGGGCTWRTLEDVENKLSADDAALINEAWETAGPAIDEVATLLEQDLDGPFFQGGEVSFLDFQWIGFLVFIRRIGEDQWSRMKACVNNFGPHEKLLASAKKWTERDDH